MLELELTTSSFEQVQCIAACDNLYNRPTYNNYCNDITSIAPGNFILSSSNHQDDLLTYKSGTGMANSHTAGMMATYVACKAIQTNVDKVNPRLVQKAQDGE
jgi:hypothetical protein